MNIDLDDAIVRLNPENNLKLHGARGACIHVHWGDLWITQEGDLKDHIVNTGESFAVSRSGVTYITAMSEAGVSVMEKCQESEVASAAAISAIALAAGQNPASQSARRYDSADEGSGLGGSQVKNLLPGVDEVDRHIARAERLRAQYFAGVSRHFANAATRVWSALRRSVGVVREFG